LLAVPHRQRLLEHIWQRTSVSRVQFATLYLAPLERYAALVQQFPASESHHHATPGGMLDHGLETVAYALKLRQSHLLPPGKTPEEQAAQAEAWTACTAYAALLHDIGKIAVDLHVEHADGSVWHPWHGPLRQPYRFRYRKAREYHLHGAAAGLLYTSVLDSGLFDWLSGQADLWAALLYVLAGQYEHAGLLGELVIQADQASVAQALGGDPGKALAAPKHALQRKLLDGLRYLLKEELKLNQSGPSDGWLTRDALWLVSKTVSDKLRAHLLSQGIEGIPANNTAVFTVLQEHGIALPTSDDKAIWKATVTSDAGWAHGFTFLKLSPALIWEAGERPEAFAGTVVPEEGEGSEGSKETPNSSTSVVSPSPLVPPPSADDGVEALIDLLGMPDAAAPKSSPGNEEFRPVAENSPAVDPAKPMPPAVPAIPAVPAFPSVPAVPAILPAEPEKSPSGEHFMDWLRQGILTRKLIINDAKALVHTVDGTVCLVTPGVFQRYVQEHLTVATLAKQEGMADWQWVQKRFEKLGLHRKQANGLNIWTCEVTGPRKSRRLHGYLLQDPKCLFEEIPPDNPYLSVH
jgi:integrating conjugative element relaxase (TIGR03760 family)